jgi:hypothetical protein
MKTEILITNLTLNNDGFGVIPETGEGVYIPPGVTIAAKLVAGETRIATLIDNNPERQSKVRYMGVYIEPVGPTPVGLESEYSKLDEKIIDALSDVDGYLTSDEVAKEVSSETSVVGQRLNNLFSYGRIARADVYFQSNQTPTNVFWAMKPEDFL